MIAVTVRTESVASGEALTGASPLKNLSEQIHLSELEAANSRLLRLVGELLVVNQQLREKNAAFAGQVRCDEQR